MGTLKFQDIIAARKIVAQFLKSTPLIHYPELSERLGFQAYIKHENHNPTGSFKVRGGLNFMHHLPQAQREKGVITATRGNHGQSIAYAAAQFGVKATVVVPHGNNPKRIVQWKPTVQNSLNTVKILTRHSRCVKHFKLSAGFTTFILVWNRHSSTVSAPIHLRFLRAYRMWMRLSCRSVVEVVLVVLLPLRRRSIRMSRSSVCRRKMRLLSTALGRQDSV